MWVKFTVFAENWELKFNPSAKPQVIQSNSMTMSKTNTTKSPAKLYLKSHYLYTYLQKKNIKFVPSGILLHPEEEWNQRGNYSRIKHFFYSDDTSQKCRAFLILKLNLWSLLYHIPQLASIQLTTHQYFQRSKRNAHMSKNMGRVKKPMMSSQSSSKYFK